LPSKVAAEDENQTQILYNAGSCLPLFAPDGWREHEEPVKLAMLDALAPQYWHWYLAFSAP
jgi:hypothetical protein